MNKEREKKLVPKLRFPEFKNSNDWEKKKFSEYIVLYRGSSPRPIQDFLTKDEKGVNWIKIGDTKHAKNNIIRFVEEKITKGGSLKSRKVRKGELILANSMSFGKTYLLEIDGCIYDGWFVLREFEQYFGKQYLLQILNSEFMQNQFIKLSAGGIVQNISSEIVYNSFLPYSNLKEQQKIADCLSSLDDLISAEDERLNALKEHKKGLMQQLFPVEGEKIPKLRFPEFNDSGEWEERKLGELGEFFGGGTPSKLEINFWNGDIPWVSSSDISEDSIVDIKISRFITKDGLASSATKIIPPNSILIVSRVGVGKLAITEKEICTSQDFTNLVSREIDVFFIAYYLKARSMLLEQLSQGMAIKGFTKEDISRLSIYSPINISEQQKIANCLSSLDKQIDVQKKKIEDLKLHKKGLMQGLFPNIN